MGPSFPAIGCHSQSGSPKRFELLPFILDTASGLSAWIQHDHERARRQLLTRLGSKGIRTVIWALFAHDYRPFHCHWPNHLEDKVVVDIMVERLPTAVAKGIDKFEIEDVISEDVSKLIDAGRLVSTEQEKQRGAAAAKRSYQQMKNRKRAQVRVYWKRMARNAAKRSLDVETTSDLDDKERAAFKAECARLFRIIVRLALKAPRCHFCRVKLTFIAFQGKNKNKVKSEEDLAHLATNASLEAIVPRHAGGCYDEDNATLSCTPCNLLKMGWPADNLKVFLSELVKAIRKVEGNLLSAQPQPTPTRSLNKEEEEEEEDLEGFLDARRAEIISGYRNGTRAECKMSTKQMIDDVKGQCLPDGMYADPCGLVLPIYVAHIDSINSSRPYEPGKVRLYYAGFNIAKRNFNTDLVPIMYLKNLVDNFDVSSVQDLLAAGVEPLVASTFFAACKKKAGTGRRTPRCTNSSTSSSSSRTTMRKRRTSQRGKGRPALYCCRPHQKPPSSPPARSFPAASKLP